MENENYRMRTIGPELWFEMKRNQCPSSHSSYYIRSIIQRMPIDMVGHIFFWAQKTLLDYKTSKTRPVIADLKLCKGMGIHPLVQEAIDMFIIGVLPYEPIESIENIYRMTRIILTEYNRYGDPPKKSKRSL